MNICTYICVQEWHGRDILEPVVGVGALLEENLHHVKVAAGAGEAQGRVVVVGCLLVDIRAPADEELHSAEVTRPGRLHQRRPPALALVLQLGPVSEHWLQQAIIESDLSLQISFQPLYKS